MTTGARRPSACDASLCARLAEFGDCSNSFICQQNRRRVELEVRLCQIERHHQATIARMTHTQRQLRERCATVRDLEDSGCTLNPKLSNRGASVPRIHLDSESSRRDEQVDGREDDGKSKCQCDCCRYGLYVARQKQTHGDATVRRRVDDTSSLQSFRQGLYGHQFSHAASQRPRDSHGCMYDTRTTAATMQRNGLLF